MVPFKLVRCFLMLAVAAVSGAACGARARLPVSAGTGPDPVLAPPQTSLLPTVPRTAYP
jgi:hypothetical protein